jgi:hypothetical protein
MKRMRLFENDGNVNWEEVVENIFFDNYVAGNPENLVTQNQLNLWRLITLVDQRGRNKL